VLSSYRRLFAVPGARAFTAAGFVLRMPISMVSLGCVLLITRTGGSYAQAGVVSATCSLVAAAVTPLLGRLADRHGQAAVLAGAAALTALGVLALVAAAVGHAPVWVQLTAAVVVSAGAAPVGTMVRARWSYATAGTALGHTAYSWESVLDEAVYITGPVLVTVLCTRVAPAAGLLAALTLGVAGACLLVPQRSTEPPRPALDGPPHRSAIRRPMVLGVTLVSVGLGGLYGSVEVAVVAYTTERGRPGWPAVCWRPSRSAACWPGWPTVRPGRGPDRGDGLAAHRGRSRHVGGRHRGGPGDRQPRGPAGVRGAASRRAARGHGGGAGRGAARSGGGVGTRCEDGRMSTEGVRSPRGAERARR
jgi:MFS family permease